MTVTIDYQSGLFQTEFREFVGDNLSAGWDKWESFVVSDGSIIDDSNASAAVVYAMDHMRLTTDYSDDSSLIPYVRRIQIQEGVAGIANEDQVESFFSELRNTDFHGELSDIYVEAVQEMSRCANRYAMSAEKMMNAVAELQNSSYWNENMNTNSLYTSSETDAHLSTQSMDWTMYSAADLGGSSYVNFGSSPVFANLHDMFDADDFNIADPDSYSFGLPPVPSPGGAEYLNLMVVNGAAQYGLFFPPYNHHIASLEAAAGEDTTFTYATRQDYKVLVYKTMINYYVTLLVGQIKQAYLINPQWAASVSERGEVSDDVVDFLVQFAVRDISQVPREARFWDSTADLGSNMNTDGAGVMYDSRISRSKYSEGQEAPLAPHSLHVLIHGVWKVEDATGSIESAPEGTRSAWSSSPAAIPPRHWSGAAGTRGTFGAHPDNGGDGYNTNDWVDDYQVMDWASHTTGDLPWKWIDIFHAPQAPWDGVSPRGRPYATYQEVAEGTPTNIPGGTIMRLETGDVAEILATAAEYYSSGPGADLAEELREMEVTRNITGTGEMSARTGSPINLALLGQTELIWAQLLSWCRALRQYPEKLSEADIQATEAIVAFVNEARPEVRPMRQYLECISDAWNSIDDQLQDFQDEIDALAAAHGLPSGLGTPEFLRRFLDGMVDAAYDHDRMMAMYYARNPEKLFFKEQCYLLTFIPELARYKKSVLDDHRSRWRILDPDYLSKTLNWTQDAETMEEATLQPDDEGYQAYEETEFMTEAQVQQRIREGRATLRFSTDTSGWNERSAVAYYNQYHSSGRITTTEEEYMEHIRSNHGRLPILDPRTGERWGQNSIGWVQIRIADSSDEAIQEIIDQRSDLMEAGWEEEGVSLTGLDIETIRRLPGRGGDYIGRPTIESDFEPGGHWYRSRIENHGHLSRLLETTVIDPAIAYERIEGTLQSKKLLPYEGYHGPMAEKYGPNIHNASLLIDGDPYGFLNKLLLSRYQKILHNMKPEVFNLLQPYIRLYKVVWEDDGTEVDVEIKFKAFKDNSGPNNELDLFKEHKLRNTGVGLRSFNFTYDGSNPFAARKSIKATLNIFSNTFDELLIERTDTGTGSKYRYIDLALKTSNTHQGNAGVRRENVELAKLNFRLKAQVGWAPPPRDSLRRLKLTDAEVTAIRHTLFDSIVTLNLTPTIHDFDIDDMGRVEFNVNYLAYVEDMFDSHHFNVFSEARHAANREVRKMRMRFYQNECDGEAVEEIKKNYAAIEDREVADSIADLIDRLIDLDRIYYLPVSGQEIREFVSEGPFAPSSPYNRPELHRTTVLEREDYEEYLDESIEEALEEYRRHGDQPTSSALREERETKITESLATMDPEYSTLSFVYLSDLLDTVLGKMENELEMVPAELASFRGAQREYADEDIDSKMSEYYKYENAFRKIRFILGPVEFVDPAGGESLFVNLGDIPISIKYFLEWLTSTMLRKELPYFSLTNFMNQLVNDLISKFLNNSSCFGYNIRQNVRLFQASYTGPQDSAWLRQNAQEPTTYEGFVKDPVTEEYKSQAVVRNHIDMIGPGPVLKDSGAPSAITKVSGMDEVNYMIYFVGRTMPTELMNGVKSQDETRGIYHYRMASDRGIVKEIKLKKTQTAGLQEVRFEQQGYDGLEQLRVVYDATINAFANVNSFPGTYIYIDPYGFSPSMSRFNTDDMDLTKYGIGGYYMIVKSNHKFGPGQADTSIEAKWVNQIDTEESQRLNDERQSNAGQEENAKSRCQQYIRRSQEARES